MENIQRLLDLKINFHMVQLFHHWKYIKRLYNQDAKRCLYSCVHGSQEMESVNVLDKEHVM